MLLEELVTQFVELPVEVGEEDPHRVAEGDFEGVTESEGELECEALEDSVVVTVEETEYVPLVELVILAVVHLLKVGEEEPHEEAEDDLVGDRLPEGEVDCDTLEDTLTELVDVPECELLGVLDTHLVVLLL